MRGSTILSGTFNYFYLNKTMQGIVAYLTEYILIITQIE